MKYELKCILFTIAISLLFFDIHREKQTDIEAESLDLLKTNEKCDQQPAKKSTLRGIYRQVCK